MNTRPKMSTALLAVIMTGGLAVPGLAAGFDAPQPTHEGNVVYLTGGIGTDEQNALKANAKDYNLLISDANAQGQFNADDGFVITSKEGREMISVDNAGPLFYAKLPPGEYKVTATHDGQARVRNVKISADQQDYLHLIWK